MQYSLWHSMLGLTSQEAALPAASGSHWLWSLAGFMLRSHCSLLFLRIEESLRSCKLESLPGVEQLPLNGDQGGCHMMTGQIWTLRDGRGILPGNIRCMMVRTVIGATLRRGEFGTPDPQQLYHRIGRKVTPGQTHLRHQLGQTHLGRIHRTNLLR